MEGGNGPVCRAFSIAALYGFCYERKMTAFATPEPTPFEKLREVTRRILSVPKREIDRREAQWWKGRAKRQK